MSSILILILFMIILYVVMGYYWFTNQMLRGLQRLAPLTGMLLCCQIFTIFISECLEIAENSVMWVVLPLGLILWIVQSFRVSTKEPLEKKWYGSSLYMEGCIVAIVMMNIYIYSWNYSEVLVLYIIILYFFMAHISVILFYSFQVYLHEQIHSLIEVTSSSEDLVDLLHLEAEQNEAYLEQMIDEKDTLRFGEHWQQVHQEIVGARLPLYSNDLAVTVALHQSQHDNANSWIDTNLWQMPVFEQALLVRILTNLFTFSKDEDTPYLQLTALTQGQLIFGPFKNRESLELCRGLVRGKNNKIYKWIQTENKRLKYNVFTYLMAVYKLEATEVIVSNETFLHIKQQSNPIFNY